MSRHTRLWFATHFTDTIGTGQARGTFFNTLFSSTDGLYESLRQRHDHCRSTRSHTILVRLGFRSGTMQWNPKMFCKNQFAGSILPLRCASMFVVLDQIAVLKQVDDDIRPTWVERKDGLFCMRNVRKYDFGEDKRCMSCWMNDTVLHAGVYQCKLTGDHKLGREDVCTPGNSLDV